MKQILVTIDTEVGELGLNQPQAFETFIEGRVGNEVYGYQKIIKLLDQNKAVGEFFVDVYPTKQLGEERLARLCKDIDQKGHRVQLHTHPDSAFDAKRRYLADYTQIEQKEIVQIGIDRIKKWTGKTPVAHRAGGYGINPDSLQVLEKVGIIFDSSFHAENPQCQLPSVHTNAPYKIGRVWEIPVSGYTRQVDYRFLSIPLLQRQHFQKLDIRYGSTAREIQEAITRAPDNSVHVLFLHSFNFLKLPYNFQKKQFGAIEPWPELFQEFSNLLAWLAGRPDCCFTDFAGLQLAEIEDYLVEVKTSRPLFNHLGNIIQEKLFHISTV